MRGSGPIDQELPVGDLQSKLPRGMSHQLRTREDYWSSSPAENVIRSAMTEVSEGLKLMFKAMRS